MVLVNVFSYCCNAACFSFSLSLAGTFATGMSSVPNLLARIQCLEAYTSELEEGQRQIFRFLGRWVDEADQLVSLSLFFC